MANTQKAKNQPVVGPWMGLWYDAEPYAMDPRAFFDCNNVRIFEGRISTANMGWVQSTPQVFNGPITMYATFIPSGGASFNAIVGTNTDIYWQQTFNNWVYITPTYTTGTIAANNGSPNLVGTGTHWATALGTGFRNNIKAGDQIYLGNATFNSIIPADPTLGWYTVQTVVDDTHITLTTNFTGLSNGAYVYTARQLCTANVGANHWSWDNFPGAGSPWNSDMFFATNGSDPLFAWDGDDFSGQYVGSMPFTAFQLRRFKNMMIYGGLVSNTGQMLPTSIANSDNGLPTTMTGGVAGQYVVTDGPYTINWLGPLGNSLMIYAGTPVGGEVLSAQFVGAPFFFVFTEVIRTRGPLGARLVAEFPDRHQFLTPDGEYRYNGLFVQQMNMHVWKKVLGLFDASRANISFCSVNQQYGEIIWALPLMTDSGSYVQTAYVEHYFEQPTNYLFHPFTKRDFPFTVIVPAPSGIPTGSFAQELTGDGNGKSWILNTVNTEAGADMINFVTFATRVTGNGRGRDLVTRVYPFIDYLNMNVNVTLKMFDTAAQAGANAPVISDTQPFNPTTGNRFSTHYRCGRLYSVTFTSSTLLGPWVCGGYDVDIIPGGLR